MRNPGGLVVALVWIVFIALVMFLFWDKILIISGWLPNDYIRVPYWVGMFLLFINIGIIVPYMMLEGKDIKLKMIGAAVIAFFGTVILAFILDAIIPKVLEIFTEETTIIYFVLAAVYVITMVGIPNYLMFEAYNES